MNIRKNRSWFRRAIGSAVFVSVLATPITVAAGPVPNELSTLVMGSSKRTVERVAIDSVPFDSIRCYSELPYLLWPADAAAMPRLSKDREAVQKWLAQSMADLGHQGFQPRFRSEFRWRKSEVWEYELVRRGIVRHDARLRIYWSGNHFIGIQNHCDGKILAVEDLDPAQAAGNEPRTYFPIRINPGEFKLVPAIVTREKREDRTVETITWDDRRVGIAQYPDPRFAEPRQDPVFTEYRVAFGSFPDQISVDENGIVWVSQPFDNSMTSFDPATGVFTRNDTLSGGGSGPDGLICGTQGRVWSGMYYSGSLGLWDSNTNTYHDYPASYFGAKMAIPVETSDGHVWVTDHELNRISEFDPETETWIRSLVMPTPDCWVVQGHEDRDRGQVYFTEYNTNALARVDVGGDTVTDIPVGGGGPAFCVYSDGKVYYSRWSESGMGVYDVASGVVTEFEFPVPNEWGGPMWLRPNGDIVFGTRNRGYIMLFHVATETFTSIEIPTAYPGLKDGLTVGPDNVIWISESGANKVTSLEYLY